MRQPAFVPVALLSFALLGFGQSFAPDAAIQLKNWLAAYDGDDWNAYLAFVKKSFVAEPEPMLRYPGFRNLTGGFDLRKIETETPTHGTMIIEERNTDQLARIVIEVEASEPHCIVKLHPEPIPPPHLNEQELLNHTRQLLERMTSTDKFAGDVLIAKSGRAVYAQAYGLADRENRLPNTLNTRFGMASVAKMFTSVAILQLVETRKIKLDDPVGKYLSDYPNREIASKITIRELLNHTGGTGDIFGPELDTHAHDLRSHEDYIHLFGSRPPRFEPGSRFEYSNYGYVILGAVIDRVSGQNYYDYVQNHIYTPAGMISTAMPEPGDKPEPGLSLGYSKREGTAWHTNRAAHEVRGTGAGGGYTTVGDLLRFANALQEKKLLGAQFTELLNVADVATPIGIHYSYGFEVTNWNGVQCFGKSGLAPGLDDNFNICPAAGYVVAVLANMDPPAGQRVSGFILNRLPKRQSPHQ